MTDRPLQTTETGTGTALARRGQALPATHKKDTGVLAVRRRVVAVPGGLRALCEVQGVPLSTWSAEESEGFLSGWAGVLNAMKGGGVQFVGRAKNGALEAAIAQRREQAERETSAPYKAMALASAGHLEALMGDGDARSLEFFLVVPGTREADIDADVATYTGLFGQIGLRLRRLEEPELTMRLAAVTRPNVPSHWYYSIGDTALYAENPQAHPVTKQGAFVARTGLKMSNTTGWIRR